MLFPVFAEKDSLFEHCGMQAGATHQPTVLVLACKQHLLSSQCWPASSSSRSSQWPRPGRQQSRHRAAAAPAAQQHYKPVRFRDTAELPHADWTRYHLQVLFVDRTDTVRARVAAGLFERIAEWNGFGRAMYPWACGMHADEGQQTDMATTVALMTQAGRLGIRRKLFAVPSEQLTAEDLDRHDIIVAMDSAVLADIQQLSSEYWERYYQRKVCLLSTFSAYVGSDILRVGGTALLEPELSQIIQPGLQESRGVVDIDRPSLQDGAEPWNKMVRNMIICSAGLCQYLIDAYPEDLPHYDPL